MSNAKNQLWGCVAGVLVVIATIAFGFFLEDVKSERANQYDIPQDIEYVIAGDSCIRAESTSTSAFSKMGKAIVELQVQCVQNIKAVTE